MTNNRIRKIIISILVFAVVLGICPAAEISAGSFRTGDKPLVICIDPEAMMRVLYTSMMALK